MKPGPELDALIAEHVMGLEVVRGHTFRRTTVPCPDNKPGCCVMHYADVPHPIDEYSRDISAAWKVLSKITESNGTFQIIHQPHAGPEYEVFICMARGLDIKWKPTKGLADTLSHAICLAALEAVGALA